MLYSRNIILSFKELPTLYDLENLTKTLKKVLAVIVDELSPKYSTHMLKWSLHSFNLLFNSLNWTCAFSKNSLKLSDSVVD